MFDVNAFGKRIKEYRLMRNLTQEKLADLLNCDIGHISRIESGKKAPSYELLIDLINTLQITADDLFCDSIVTSHDVFQYKIEELLRDCSPYEMKIIEGVCASIIEVIRNNHLP